MEKQKKSINLNAFMLKKEFCDEDFVTHLSDSADVNPYPFKQEHGLIGNIYIKKQSEKEPPWLNHIEKLSGAKIEDLKNTSTSAVVFIKSKKDVFAFTFGYGRYLIRHSRFVQDFGIKTALNTLNHESLRSIDLHSFDEQPVQKRAQVTKASDISTFGVDISKDILRSVTGIPNDNVSLRNISGGDSVFSFSMDMLIEEIDTLVEILNNYYNNDNYKKSFSWVDNIKRVKLKSKVERLNNKVFKAVKNKNKNITIHVPEVINWDDVLGFSFTRSKKEINTLIDVTNYYKYNLDKYSMQNFHGDYLFVNYNDGLIKKYSIYKSIYYEIKENKSVYILFAGVWYEIEKNFIDRINETISKIKSTTLTFPSVYEYEKYNEKKEKKEMKLEDEGDYNSRVVDTNDRYYLLDKKLIKTNRTTSSIELCDLLTKDNHLIHVKHLKGGSSGLSHLFSQGHVSAEILLGDRNFRKKAREVLRKVDKDLDKLIPINKLKSNDFEIVYLILGADSTYIKTKLPFFSKVNLTKAFENLTQRGFKVSIGGVPKTLKPN